MEPCWWLVSRMSSSVLSFSIIILQKLLVSQKVPLPSALQYALESCIMEFWLNSISWYALLILVLSSSNFPLRFHVVLGRFASLVSLPNTATCIALEGIDWDSISFLQQMILWYYHLKDSSQVLVEHRVQDIYETKRLWTARTHGSGALCQFLLASLSPESCKLCISLRIWCR